MFLDRREFLRTAVLMVALGHAERAAFAADAQQFTGVKIFERIVAKSDAEHWKALPIGDLVAKVAEQFLGTPYRASTLEISIKHEIPSVNLTGLDCFTFVETSLAFARMIKFGGKTPADLLREIKFTRYRNGMPGDYSTRLHYMSDWLEDNAHKKVVEILSDLPGSEPFSPHIDFMSHHVDLYRQLKNSPELVRKISKIEDSLNNRKMTYVPLDKILSIEPMLKTGDIVSVCTSAPGLDVAHDGLILCAADGIPQFMNASSLKADMKVVVEHVPISKSLNWSKNLIGAIFARPLDPVKKP